MIAYGDLLKKLNLDATEAADLVRVEDEYSDFEEKVYSIVDEIGN